MSGRRTAAVRARLRNALGWVRAHPTRALERAVTLLALLASATFFVVPLYWLFSAAVRPSGSITYPPSLFPSSLTIETFLELLTETAFFGTYLLNSLLVSTATVALTVVIATLAGYALSQYSLPHQRAIMVLLLVVQMIPVVAVVVPLYRVYALTGLLDSLAVVVLTDTVLAVPVATWLIKGYFDTVPPELEEAVQVAGASRARAFRILVPLARPTIGAAALYAFVVSWNQFIVPLTFTTSQSVATYPLGLYAFISRRGAVDWRLLGAASLVAMVPVLLLFVAFQRQFVAGLVGSDARAGGQHG